ncbi:hypothetical protein ACVCIH_13080 [Burkholderia glumae]|uniref:hypothetical protein n=1 Tax=Burkholderia glumae TaxID=337 RepID=UPI002036EF59|nr:hypothetical protein [Burkholderia glumae]MCM2493709.1 hypothetical protein [Burkholderia glumae]
MHPINGAASDAASAHVTAAHAERETLAVLVNIPEHAERTTTALFARTRKVLIEREGGRCFICNATAQEAGHPLEAHHHPIERSFAELIDWDRFKAAALAGEFGERVRAFDWAAFTHWEQFVDDMTVNGLLLCKAHHIGKDEGIHALPFPIWIAQRYAREGYQFSDIEIIHHNQE